MTDLMNPPTNGTSTRKVKTEIIDTLGEVLENLSPDARIAFLSVVNQLRGFPGEDTDTAVRGLTRIFAKSAGHDELLAFALQFHRKDLKR